MCSKTSPCWVDREVVPAAKHNFPKGRSETYGCWAHTKWVGNEKSPSRKLSTTKCFWKGSSLELRLGLIVSIGPAGRV